MSGTESEDTEPMKLCDRKKNTFVRESLQINLNDGCLLEGNVLCDTDKLLC